MQTPAMMTRRQFRARFHASAAWVVLGTVALVAGYIMTMLDFTGHQIRSLFEMMGVVLVLLVPASSIQNRRVLSPIEECLDAEASGTITARQLEVGFGALAHLPVRMWAAGCAWWIVGGSVLAVALALRSDSFDAYALGVITLAFASAGFVSSTMQFFINKRNDHALLTELAARIGDVDRRRALMPTIALRRKLIVAVTGVSFVTVVFAMCLSLVIASSPLERAINEIQTAHLDRMMTNDEFDFDRALETGRALRIFDDLILFDVETGDVLAGGATGFGEDERAFVFSRASGDSQLHDSSNVYAWRRSADGRRALVAVRPWADVRGDAGGTAVIFVIVALGAGLLAFVIAWLLADDASSASEELSAAAADLAGGNLVGRVRFESEDELGELGRRFESMAAWLRRTVGGVAAAADEVEAAAAEISQVADSVSEGAEAQQRGVQAAVGSMEALRHKTGDISGSAQALNRLVEESSSSILEMGAAGDELNDTAGVLNSRVDEVSSSVEEMIRSVQEVGSQTGHLSEAAGETSSSMEEMASAMRKIDETAEEASRLSGQALAAADRGHERVRETIDGMETIERATAAAEAVILGLGSRTQEIGTILDVIDDVADETNLLALNAAIIAAQAGEHGRSFSVVADEMKELADRVLESTKEIGGLIRAVQSESENATAAITDGSKSVADGVDRAREAGVALSEITDSSRASGEHIGAIVRSVQEQTKAATHVVEMMERVNLGAEAIHRASEEQGRGNDVVYRSTVAMREVAQLLRATTEEQSRGGRRIRESIEGVRDAALSIDASLQSQTTTCDEIVEFLEGAAGASESNTVASQRLARSTSALRNQAEALRADVGQFILDESDETSPFE